MSQPEIVLHEWSISPFCGKVRKVLALKRLPYRIEDYGGVRALKARGLSSSGKLPVLDYNGTRIVDSSAIVRFLDRTHPEPPLFPADVDASLAHLLEDWADESLYFYELYARLFDDEALDKSAAIACGDRNVVERTLYRRGLAGFRDKVVAQGLGRYPRETVLDNLRQHLNALDGRLARDSWLAGPSMSIADIAVAAQLDEFVRTSAWASEIRALPRLNAWLERCALR
ncbi:MAG: glutathione S-transferase family protein [Myxococcales bacterium]